MWSKLKFIQKNLVWAILVAILMGTIAGLSFELSFLKNAIIPLTVLMIYPIMITLNIKSVFKKCHFSLQITTQSINFIIIPLVAFLIGHFILADMQYAAFGLLLIALLPTSGMTVSWTQFAKGNVNVAVKMTVIGLIAGSLFAPLYTKLIMGKVIEVPVLNIFYQIGIIVFIPMLLGYFTKILLIKNYGEKSFNNSIKPKLPLLSTIGVLGIIFVAMSLKTKSILSDPSIIPTLLLALLSFYFITYLITSIIGKYFFQRQDAIALVYGSVMRNLSVALAIAITSFGKEGLEIALIIALAFIIQVKSAAWYIRLANYIFPSQNISLLKKESAQR